MTRRPRPERRATAALLGLALLGAWAAGCGRQNEAPLERPPAPVTVAAATSEEVPVYIDALGKAAARESVSIQPQVSGRITRVHFTDGADVKAGDLLFTIDPRPFQAEVQKAEANLAEAEVALNLAKITFARVASVSDPRAVSRQDFDAKKNAVEAAEAVVKQHQALVQRARLDLEYTAVRSPIGGRAGQRAVDAGNVVSANEGSLLVIQRLDPIYADFSVAETELGAVQRHMALRTLRVEVRLPEEPDRPRVGKLTFVDNAVNDGTATVKLRALLPNGDRRFWPGRFVNVRLILDTRKDAVLIPAEAPQMSAKGPFVYVVKDDMTAELRVVTLGQRYRDSVVIERGLEAGEHVVVQGHLGVTPGGKVNVVRAGTPSTAAAEGKP